MQLQTHLLHTSQATSTSTMSRSQSSYAKELLNHSLEVLSAIDVGIPEASIASSSPSDRVATAAKDFASTKPITRAKLADILNKLDQGKTGGQRPQSPTQNVTDLLLEADLMARAVTMAWRETMDVLMDNAQRMSTELNWWQSIAHSRRFVGLYFLQSE
jgi:nuclear control of ATPase protein 2